MPTPADLRRLAYQLLEMADELESSLSAVHQLTQPDTESKTESMQESAVYRGPKLESLGPFAQLARERGLSIRKLAVDAGLNWHSVKTWDQRDQMPVEACRALKVSAAKAASLISAAKAARAAAQK